MYEKLSFDDLNYFNIDLSELCGKELGSDCSEGLIGQKRAVKAIDFGFAINERGYNIYAAGNKGLGKTSYALKRAKKQAENMKVPPDYCYVYNFEDPKRPRALCFAPGLGKQFKNDMRELSDFLSEELQKVFSSEEYENERAEILKNYQNKRDSLMESMEEIAGEYDFGVKTTNSGMYFLPKIDGETIDEEEYDRLDEKEKSKFSKLSDIVQEKASEIMRKIKSFEKRAKNEMHELEYKIGMFTIAGKIGGLKSAYKEYPCAVSYLESVSEDVLNNLQDFMEKDDDEEQISSMLPWLSKKSDDSSLNKYKVNLIVDNSGLSGAPVVKDFNPAYYNLIGEIEYDNEFGNLVTDFMKIKPGLMHKANGGFLILQAADLLINDKSWDCLKLALKNKELEIAPLREHLSSATSTLKPAPIPLDIKIILTGSAYYYDLLCDFDEDFDELFKIFAEFDYEMELCEENILKTAAFIKGFSEASVSIDDGAVKALIKHAVRNSWRSDKITADFGLLKQITEQSMALARANGKHTVDSEAVALSVSEHEYRVSMYQEKVNALFEDGYVSIDTTGEKIGQINGLSVIDTGNYSFGCPLRITATTFIGNLGIINIEKEAEMSGNIHEKGMQVLSGYFGQTYAQDFPLSLSAKICFEQSYSEIDGDSASLAELLAILSSLSEIPLKQEIAVTGSVNQMGEVQAVGGVTQKTEGFFDLCERRGLTGGQGVVIPKSCVRDLVLKDSVLQAVKNETFHIYSVSAVDDALLVLTGMEAGKRSKSGKFEPKTIHALAYKKLKAYCRRASQEHGAKK